MAGFANRVELSWDAVSDGDLTYYAVYRDTVESFTPTNNNNIIYLPSTSTSYSDSEITNRQDYYYQVTAIDSMENESGFSTEVGGYILRIEDLQVSSITSAQAKISWVTNLLADARVNYGLSTSLGSTEYISTMDDVHLVTLSSLTASTTYYYEIVSGTTTDDNNGNYYTFTTAPTLTGGSNYLTLGHVFKEDHSTPAENTLVFLTVTHNGETSLRLAKQANASGVWDFDLGNLMDSLLTEHFTYSSGDFMHIWAQGGADGVADTLVAIDGSGFQECGNLYLRPNQAPSFAFLTPPAGGTNCDLEYLIQWQDSDTEDNAYISLYYDDGLDTTGILINVSDQYPSGLREDDETDEYLWNTSSVSSGTYYLYAILDDQNNTTVVTYSVGQLQINRTPQISVINPLVTGEETDIAYIIKWNDSDADNNAAISFYYDDGLDTTGILIDASVQYPSGIYEDDDADSLNWNTSALPSGNSYYVYAKIEDGLNPTVYDYAPGMLTINHVVDRTVNLVSGYNFFAMPLASTSSHTSFSLISDVSNCVEVSRWDKATQSWKSAVDLGFGAVGEDFSISLGEGYLFHVTDISNPVFSGYMVDSPVVLDLVQNFNLISIPDTSQHFTSYSLVETPANCRRVIRWSKAGQTWEYAFDFDGNTYGTLFDIELDEGYFMEETAAENWIPTGMGANSNLASSKKEEENSTLFSKSTESESHLASDSLIQVIKNMFVNPGRSGILFGTFETVFNDSSQYQVSLKLRSEEMESEWIRAEQFDKNGFFVNLGNLKALNDSIPFNWKSGDTAVVMLKNNAHQYEFTRKKILDNENPFNFESINWIATAIDENIAEIPTTYFLNQNYPNPFNPVTTVDYGLPHKSKVSIKVYNLMGKLIRTLVDSEQSAGYYSVEWNALNSVGSKVSTGLYIYRMKTNEHIFINKMMFIK